MFLASPEGRQVTVRYVRPGVIVMILGLVLDTITLPFRIIFALLRGAKFEFRRFSKPHRRV